MAQFERDHWLPNGKSLSDEALTIFGWALLFMQLKGYELERTDYWEVAWRIQYELEAHADTTLEFRIEYFEEYSRSGNLERMPAGRMEYLKYFKLANN